MAAEYVDLALEGSCDIWLASRVAGELDDLSLPYHFDVVALSRVEHLPLQEHIQRVGVVLYP